MDTECKTTVMFWYIKINKKILIVNFKNNIYYMPTKYGYQILIYCLKTKVTVRVLVPIFSNIPVSKLYCNDLFIWKKGRRLT